MEAYLGNVNCVGGKATIAKYIATTLNEFYNFCELSVSSYTPIVTIKENNKIMRVSEEITIHFKLKEGTDGFDICRGIYPL